MNEKITRAKRNLFSQKVVKCLHEQMIVKNISKSYLASELMVGPSTVGWWFNNTLRMPLNRIREVSKILNSTIFTQVCIDEIDEILQSKIDKVRKGRYLLVKHDLENQLNDQCVSVNSKKKEIKMKILKVNMLFLAMAADRDHDIPSIIKVDGKWAYIERDDKDLPQLLEYAGYFAELQTIDVDSYEFQMHVEGKRFCQLVEPSMIAKYKDN